MIQEYTKENCLFIYDKTKSANELYEFFLYNSNAYNVIKSQLEKEEDEENDLDSEEYQENESYLFK